MSFENSIQAEIGNLSCVLNCNRYKNYQHRNVSTANHDVSENSLNAHTTNARTNSAAREQTNGRPKNRPSIEQDLWQQLKRIEIPTFWGDKHTYQGWKAAFTACIDSAPATEEYKILQLRQYLSGEALKAIIKSWALSCCL